MSKPAPALEQLAAAMRAEADNATAGARRSWREAAAMVDTHAQRVRQTSAAALAEHLAVVDRILTPGAWVDLTPDGVAELRTAIAAAVENAMAATVVGTTPPAGPKPGDRVEDGGVMGTLIRCPQCSGDGLLHQPDELPPTAEPTPEPEPEIAPDLLRHMQQIAQGYRGLAYDPNDRPEEVAAVVAAARAAGLVPVPDESLIRAYRGCTPPTPPGDPVLAAEAAQYAWPLQQRIPGQAVNVDDVLTVLTAQARPVLEALYAAGAANGAAR